MINFIQIYVFFYFRKDGGGISKYSAKLSIVQNMQARPRPSLFEANTAKRARTTSKTPNFFDGTAQQLTISLLFSHQKLLYLISLVNNTYAIVLDKNLLYSAPVLLIYFNCQKTEPSFIKNFESSSRVF